MSIGQKNEIEKENLPRISDAEWTVLKTVWRLKTPTARDVVEQLHGEADWKPKTIHTLLGRLVQKGALIAEKLGREYVFKPLVSERQCRLSASRSFLEKVFDGEIAPFLACFLEHKKLSRKEIQELKSILEE
jgi:BlaI family penicillinase repressor